MIYEIIGILLGVLLGLGIAGTLLRITMDMADIVGDSWVRYDKARDRKLKKYINQAVKKRIEKYK